MLSKEVPYCVCSIQSHSPRSKDGIHIWRHAWFKYIFRSVTWSSLEKPHPHWRSEWLKLHEYGELECYRLKENYHFGLLLVHLTNNLCTRPNISNLWNVIINLIACWLASAPKLRMSSASEPDSKDFHALLIHLLMSPITPWFMAFISSVATKAHAISSTMEKCHSGQPEAMFTGHGNSHLDRNKLPFMPFREPNSVLSQQKILNGS